MAPSPRRKRRLVLPAVLAVTVTAAVAAAAIASTPGCGDDQKPRVDAGVGDAPPDIPLV